MDGDLKQTRDQVSEFKQRFRTLSTFIQKKGGIDVLNNLPNVGSDVEPTSADAFGRVPEYDTASVRTLGNQSKRIALRG